MQPDAFLVLARSPASRLERLLRDSIGPSPDALAGFEWRGCNTGWLTRMLGLQKFVKGFFRADGRLEGYNIPVAQNGLDAPWILQPSPENPRRYAFYRAAPVDPASADNLYPEALLLDYGASLRNAGSPFAARLLRDYLVQPDPADPDLLLGKAYFALGSLRLPSNYFILGRLRRTGWAP